MKTLLVLIPLAFLSAAPLRAAENTKAEQDLIAVVKDIQAQQKQIAENQAKVEQKLAIVAEAVRVARIYSSRAGH